MVSLFTTRTSTLSRHMIVAVRLASSEMSAISYKAKTVLHSIGIPVAFYIYTILRLDGTQPIAETGPNAILTKVVGRTCEQLDFEHMFL